jgi:hypothetical protein
MRANGRIGVVVLAGALALAGCGDRSEPPAEAPQQDDGVIPPGAIPSAPEVEPGNTASRSTAAAPASAPTDSAATAGAPGAGQRSQADSAAAPPPR